MTCNWLNALFDCKRRQIWYLSVLFFTLFEKIAKGDRSDTFRSFSSDFMTKKRGTFNVGCEVDCWVVCSESKLIWLISKWIQNKRTMSFYARKMPVFGLWKKWEIASAKLSIIENDNLEALFLGWLKSHFNIHYFAFVQPISSNSRNIPTIWFIKSVIDIISNERLFLYFEEFMFKSYLNTDLSDCRNIPTIFRDDQYYNSHERSG